MTEAGYMVELHGLTRKFGDYLALDGVSLAVRSGEFFSLLGPSGCGKSTLLRIIAGLERADTGTLSVDGLDMQGVAPWQRPCNMVFQNYAIFPHLNVRDNVAYGLRKHGLSAAEKSRRVEEMLGAVRLEGLGGRKPDQLSGGQRQRVALARALVRRPKVLLLDEPLGALDKTLREEMQVELRELQRAVGITFIFVTHDQEEALCMSDRIAVMSRGRVLQVATPLELYERPNCCAVAGFIGDMNFLDGRTERPAVNGGWIVRVEGFGEVEFDEALDAECPGFAHRIAIRPEKLKVTGQKPEAAICVRGTVASSSYWGDQSQFRIAVEGCRAPLTIAAHNVDASGSGGLAQGSEVWLSASRGALLRLDE